MKKRIWKSFLIPHLIEEARLNFKRIYFLSPSEGNDFFETYTPGNIIENINKPYERFHDYELLLEILEFDDRSKYQRMHKGTPFYFLGWTAFDMRNYEKAAFYLINAIEEDIKSFPDKWESTPGANALLLNYDNSGTAKRVVLELSNLVDDLISDFNNRTNRSKKNNINKQTFIEKFIKNLIYDQKKRSILTAFYSFILEFDDRLKEIKIKSKNGGSIEPIISHLFKGSLIFESLLKEFYNFSTLEKIFNDQQSTFQHDFRFRSHLKTFENNGIAIIAKSTNKQDRRTAFEVTARVRNTSGHKLTWPDQFNEQNYMKLFNQQINAIFYVIIKHFNI